MCRLGFMSSEDDRDYTNLITLAGISYGKANDDGFGYALIDDKENKFIIEKTATPTDYWLGFGKKLIAKDAIMHCRKATTGDVKDKNSHPFVSEDGRYALAHNGVISSYEEIEKELKDKGHKFSSECDSEIFLHAWEEWGKDFIKKLKDGGVTGYATILILDKTENKLYAYTDGSNLVFYKSKGMLIGFSDSDILGKESESAVSEMLYTIMKGKVITKEKIGTLSRWSGSNFAWNKQIGSYVKSDYKCEYCPNKSFSNISAREDHWKGFHKMNKELFQRVNAIFWTVPNDGAMNIDGLVIDSYSDNIYHCPLCNEYKGSKAILPILEHLKMYHNLDEKSDYICNTCENAPTFAGLDKFEKHMEKHLKREDLSSYIIESSRVFYTPETFGLLN